MLHDLMGNINQVVNGDALLEAGLFAEEPAPVGAGQMEHRLAQRLGGNGARVHRRPAQEGVAFQ